MKRIVCLLLCLLTLIACQPTPTEDVVANKAEGKLESAIHSDPVKYPAESIGLAGEEGAESLWAALSVPEQASLELTGPVYCGTLHIQIDAAMHLPEVSKVPVLLVGRLHPSAADKQRIAETMTNRAVFFGTDPLGNERWLNTLGREKKALAALETKP